MSDDDLVYLYRGGINRSGEYIQRRDLPAGAEPIDIAHFGPDIGSVDPNGPIPPPRMIPVFLIRE